MGTVRLNRPMLDRGEQIQALYHVGRFSYAHLEATVTYRDRYQDRQQIAADIENDRGDGVDED